jgi:hypothetical protein
MINDENPKTTQLQTKSKISSITYIIYSSKSPGPEGLAWAFKLSSQALNHGLSRALAGLGSA